MTTLVVSIGVPTYNRAALLERTIEMVLVQDYSHLDVLISDNHSDDETEQVGRAAAERDRMDDDEYEAGFAREHVSFLEAHA